MAPAHGKKYAVASEKSSGPGHAGNNTIYAQSHPRAPIAQAGPAHHPHAHPRSSVNNSIPGPGQHAIHNPQIPQIPLNNPPPPSAAPVLDPNPVAGPGSGPSHGPGDPDVSHTPFPKTLTALEFSNCFDFRILAMPWSGR
ncbi:uncharacterized protein Z518_00589 [Rhinocladiella mackenziei CBS 650.93]|uniref:Uncharacterized protein n=1 Tax=Rhinocladiella mackenziei CBS 650.93 TaxID=1442369 RepID=A0A0D2ITX0_9EURO|nr:uncharacterized protein Z518_00589 [Rhinocladiella mackenziei CBS 650.93]KIX09509.1 hypothetical protein Z518_00589 [Rhinocladiella mackenziei CBS 650.93]